MELVKHRRNTTTSAFCQTALAVFADVSTSKARINPIEVFKVGYLVNLSHATSG